MKKFLILFAAVSALCPAALFGRVVTLPCVDMNGNLQTLIRSVELTDTSTRFNMSMLHRPGWWCQRDSVVIVGKATGKTYPLLRSEGYEIGTKQPVGSNGRHDYVYVYPPLDPADTVVSLQEVGMANKTVLQDYIGGIHLGDSQPVEKYAARLHGRVVGSDLGFLYIVKDSPRMRDVVQSVPVDNGEFSVLFSSDSPVFYSVFSGVEYLSGGMSGGISFTPEGDDLECDIVIDASGEVEKMEVDAPVGSYTRSYSDYNRMRYDMWDNSPVVKHRDSLENARAYYLPKFYELEELSRTNPEKKDSINEEFRKFFSLEERLTPEGVAAEEAVRELIEVDIENAEMAAVEEMKDLAGLYALVHKVWSAEDASKYIDIYRRAYRGLFPDNPYSKIFEELDNTFEPIPGNPYNDFSAPDFDGKVYTLSELIKGKPAVIDLWASWCGPCRDHSIALIPVYEEFAPKGFTIVGVAREAGTAALARNAVDKDGYPWQNLVELDNKGGIWALYRRQNAAGGIFLVDADGKIVAVDPTADEVREYLEKTLK